MFVFVHLELELGPSPMSPLGIVPDLIASLHSDPLWYGPVLLLFLGKHSLDTKRFMRRLNDGQDQFNYDLIINSGLNLTIFSLI